MCLRYFVPLVFFVVATTPLVSQKPVAGDLEAGVAKIDISPSDLTLNAVGPKPYVGVHDPIFARALVLRTGHETAAMVSLDLIDLPFGLEALQQRVQAETGIAADHLIISVAHDHSAPHFSHDLPACHPDGPPGGACSEIPQMEAFQKVTSDKIVEVVKQAEAALQPARIGLGKGSADVNGNRDLYGPKGWGMGYDPSGPSDKTVWVVDFETPDGKPIALLFNYAVHSIVTMDGQMVSGDLAGEAERIIEKHYGGDFVALFTLGAAGDQNPKFPEFPPPMSQRNEDPAEVRKQVFAAMQAQGFMLGAEVLRVAGLIQTFNSNPRMSAEQTTFTCPIAPGKAQSEGLNGSVPIHLSLLMLGKIAFVGVSAEVVANIGFHLQKSSPLSDTILVTIANGRAGYLVDDASYDRKTFEVHASPVAQGCAEEGIVNGLDLMIRQQMMGNGSVSQR